MSHFLRAASLGALALWIVGCAQAVAVDPPSPVVPRDPKVNVFKTAVWRYTEEVRVVANRFELGMCRSESELLLDELKAACARIPEAPSPEHQAKRDECVQLVKQLETMSLQLAHLDTTRRRVERAANLAALRGTAVESPSLARAEWVPLEEQRWGEPSSEIAQLDALKAETVIQGVSLVRNLNGQLKNSLGLGPIVALSPESPILR